MRMININGTSDVPIVTINSSGKPNFENITEFSVQNNILKYTVYKMGGSSYDNYDIRYLNLSVDTLSVTTPGGSISGEVPDGSIDYRYIPTVTITVPDTTTVIKPYNLISNNKSSVSLYTTSDFSDLGKITDGGHQIIGNSATLSAKVVSTDNSPVKYYKVIFNVVNPPQNTLFLRRNLPRLAQISYQQ